MTICDPNFPMCRNPGAFPRQFPRLTYGERQVPGLLRPELLRGNGMGELTAGQTFWGVASVVSVGLSAYHGYKRNQSIGWAIVWGLLGGIAPVITPAVAFAQGFGERAR